jgi:hypothetical protein
MKRSSQAVRLGIVEPEYFPKYGLLGEKAASTATVNHHPAVLTIRTKRNGA